MSAPRRRVIGTGPDLRPAFDPDTDAGWTGSDDEIDALYDLTPGAAWIEPCTCFRDGEYVPESCNRADHRAGGDAA